MATETIVNTRAALRHRVVEDARKRLAGAAQTIEGGALDGIRVVSLGSVDEMLDALLDEPLAPPDESTGEVTTPAGVMVWAVCPKCGIAQTIGAVITSQLVVDGDGSELRLKAKAKARTHLCGQMTLQDAAEKDQLGFDLEDIVGKGEPAEDESTDDDPSDD